jgi:Uma2 family endonuclease
VFLGTATVIELLEKPAIRELALPITVEQYHQLGMAGIISERTELLRGVILEKMTKSPLHVFLVQRIFEWLRGSLAAGFIVRKEEPLTLTDSEPEPDIAVVIGAADDYRAHHPASAELIVEVAIATLDLDREKANVYAAAGVPEYWIVIPAQQAVEIYSDPSPRGYQTQRTHRIGDGELRSLRLSQLAILPAAILS